jgi:protein gp37
MWWANWVIIGAMTGIYARHYRIDEWHVRRLIDECRDRTVPVPVFVKDSLAHVSTLREYPNR